MTDEQREREITRKAQIAIMPRQELNAHAYLLEQEQEEYETELAKLRSELDREREENQKLCEQLQSAQQDRDKLIEGLRSFINEVDQKEDEAWKKWEKEADMYFQGASYAFDFVQAKLRDILKETGVTVDE
jgi:hypothetical protein